MNLRTELPAREAFGLCREAPESYRRTLQAKTRPAASVQELILDLREPITAYGYAEAADAQMPVAELDVIPIEALIGIDGQFGNESHLPSRPWRSRIRQSL